MSDQSVRSLLLLQATASTARTLSLHAVWRKEADDPEYKSHPFFKSPILNRAIIVKHRLRANEQEIFADSRRSATKVILPIDPTDLKLGARSFFVHQPGYIAFMEEVAGPNGNIAYDDKVLTTLDKLPSLDPFLMREALMRAEIRPARCYFLLTEADSQRIFTFVKQELTPLINATMAGAAKGAGDASIQKFSRLILEDTTDHALIPLQMGLNMEPAEFQEGVFCWKGFIYYKWMLADLFPKVNLVLTGITEVKCTGPSTMDERQYITTARRRLNAAINDAANKVKRTLKIYDDAYAQMTQRGNPGAFRDFLKNAPGLFFDLGDRLGAINHIVSFWNYRFPRGAKLRLTTPELIDLFLDFEAGIIVPGAIGVAAAKPAPPLIAPSAPAA